MSKEKVGMGGTGPVSVRRGVNPIRAFLDMLSKRRFGVFMIWLHEGRVVKWSEVSKPTVRGRTRGKRTLNPYARTVLPGQRRVTRV